MARYNDNDPDIRKWTNRKLMAEARKYANLETYGGGPVSSDEQLYRDTYLTPVLNEIERRFVRSSSRNG